MTRNVTRMVWVAVFLLASSGGVHAQRSLAQRTIGITFEGGVPHISFRVSDFVDAYVRSELSSGLVRNFATRVYAYREDGGGPVVATQISCEVVYDLFDERYRIRTANPDGEQTHWVTSFEEVVSACLSVHELPLGHVSDWVGHMGEQIFFAAQIEFNPVSQATVERIRRLLARGGGFGDESVFGSFVSMFVTRTIGAADRVLRFRSQSVTVP